MPTLITTVTCGLTADTEKQILGLANALGVTKAVIMRRLIRLGLAVVRDRPEAIVGNEGAAK